MAMATARVAAMVVAAAVFFSTFYSVSPQAEAPAPSALGEAPAPSAVAGCTDKLGNLSDCLTYVLNGSNQTKPDKGCCPAVAGLVESNPICLCVLVGTNVSESIGFSIDVKRALKLPSVCAVETPPASTCSAFGIPIGAPIASEGSPSPAFGIPIGAPTASEGSPSPEGAVGSPSPSPSPGNNNSEASSIAGSALPITFGIAIAFLPTIFF